jgi:hypothetical protein
MNYAHLTEEIRRHARSRFQTLGAEAHAELIETILIRDGYYCGRRFECDGWTAIWFVEEQQVKLYDRDGRVLTTCSVADLLQDRRTAA